MTVLVAFLLHIVQPVTVHTSGSITPLQSTEQVSLSEVIRICPKDIKHDNNFRKA